MLIHARSGTTLVANAYTVETADGTRCRYCGRPFAHDGEADAHISDLTAAGMLQDHIAIHWPGPQ